MFPSERFGAHRIFSLSLLGLVLAGASCGGGGNKADAGPPSGTDGAIDRGGTGGIGGGGGADVGPIGSTPAAQCTGLVSIVCSRLVACDPAVTPMQQANCNKVLNTQIGCDRATSEAFPACIADTQALSCASLFTETGLDLPGSCTAPLNIPLSTAQTKCIDLVAADCTRAFQCGGVAAPTPAQLNACIEDTIFADDGVPCLVATGVGPKYDGCLAELKAAPCAPAPVDGGAPDAGTGNPDAANPVPSCSEAVVFLQ